MHDLKNTTALVKHMLETDIGSRSSDNRLYLKVLEAISKNKGININCISVVLYLSSLAGTVFPPFESVRRARQKLQRRYPELAASKEVREFRAENEEVYEEYATGAV